MATATKKELEKSEKPFVKSQKRRAPPTPLHPPSPLPVTVLALR